MSGRVLCAGGIVVDVRKVLGIVSGEASTAMVRTVDYTYHVTIDGLGNLFRYCSPHDDGAHSLTAKPTDVERRKRLNYRRLFRHIDEIGWFITHALPAIDRPLASSGGADAGQACARRAGSPRSASASTLLLGG